MVILFQQYAENRDFFPNFSADGLHNWDTLLVIPLKFQEIKHQPYTLTEPKNKILISDDRGFSEVQTICPKPLSPNSRRREKTQIGIR